MYESIANEETWLLITLKSMKNIYKKLFKQLDARFGQGSYSALIGLQI